MAYPIPNIRAPFSLEAAMSIIRTLQQRQQAQEMAAYRTQALKLQRESQADALKARALQAGAIPVFSEPTDIEMQGIVGTKAPGPARESAAELYKGAGFSGHPPLYRLGNTWFAPPPAAAIEAGRKAKREEAQIASTEALTGVRRATEEALRIEAGRKAKREEAQIASTEALTGVRRATEEALRKKAQAPPPPAKLSDEERILIGKFSDWTTKLLAGEEIDTTPPKGLSSDAQAYFAGIRIGKGPVSKLSEEKQKAIVKGLQGIVSHIQERGSPLAKSTLSGLSGIVPALDFKFPGWSAENTPEGTPLQQWFGDMRQILIDSAMEESATPRPQAQGAPAGPEPAAMPAGGTSALPQAPLDIEGLLGASSEDWGRILDLLGEETGLFEEEEEEE